MSDNIENNTQETVKKRGRPKGLRKGEDGKWYKADGTAVVSTVKTDSLGKQKKEKNKKILSSTSQPKTKHIINYDSEDGPSHEDLMALEEELNMESKDRITSFREDHDKSHILVTNWLDEPSHIRVRQITTNPEDGLDKIQLVDKALVSTKYVVKKFHHYTDLFDSNSNKLLLSSLESFLEDSCSVFNSGMESDTAREALSILFSCLQNLEPRTLYYIYTVSDIIDYSTPVGIIFREKPFGSLNIYDQDMKTGNTELLKTLDSDSGFYIIYPKCESKLFDDPYSNFNIKTVSLSLQTFIAEYDTSIVGIGTDNDHSISWGWTSSTDSLECEKSKFSYADLVNSSKRMFDMNNTEDQDSDISELNEEYDDDDENEEDYDEDEEESIDDESYDRVVNKHSSYLDMNDFYDSFIEKPYQKRTNRNFTGDDIYYPGTDKDKRDFENLSDGGFRKTNHGLSDDNGFDNYQDD